VKWLDSADAGKTAELGIGDICLPDSRSLEQHHPKYRQYKAILDKAAQLKLAGKQRQSPQQRRLASAVAASPDVVSEAEGEGASEGDAHAQDREGEAAEVEEIEAAEEPRQFVLRPPQGASGPLCVLCKLPTLLPADPAWSLSAEERREVAGLYGGQHVTHWRYTSVLLAALVVVQGALQTIRTPSCAHARPSHCRPVLSIPSAAGCAGSCTVAQMPHAARS
jgi:hypothetical protein